MANTNNKNIIICADGTGNKGGYTPDSNVYKTYNGVDLHTARQISYYDNGVGTSTNKFWRALSGAFGFGFQRNVQDLYRFLAMNYEPGDRVFLFGFSRGAATVRAFLGFIACCGLVKGKNLPHEKLEKYTRDAFDAYRHSRSDPQRAKEFCEHENSHHVIDIHFVGVWDTVSALGLPGWFDRLGLISIVLTKLFNLVDRLLNIVWKHHFYRYELSNNIKHAYQALALDDARSAFKPMVWNENGFKGKVEQVWFAGMHSNVGGGYEREGMANVALYWMLVRAADKKLKLKPGFIEQCEEDANVNGRLYDSRDGLAILYPFHPRQVEALCAGKLVGTIGIHETVFERMKMKTANYAPLRIPGTFKVAYTDLKKSGQTCTPVDDKHWPKAVSRVSALIRLRKVNYVGLFLLTLSLLALVIYTWTGHVDYWGRSGLPGDIADVMDYLTPFMFENLVELAVMRCPLVTMAALACLWLFWTYNKLLRRHTVRAAIIVREIVMKNIK